MDLESIFFPPSAIAASSQMPADEQNQLIADRVLIAALKVRSTCGRTWCRYVPCSSLSLRTAVLPPSSLRRSQPIYVALPCCQRSILIALVKTGSHLSAVCLSVGPSWQLPHSVTHGQTLLGQAPTLLMPQVLCALVAHDDSKQRWLQSAGVLQLLERLLQSHSAGPEASDDLSLYLVSLLLSPSEVS